MPRQTLKVLATAGALLSTVAAGNVHAVGSELPRTILWSAYPTGTTAYTQAVAIGSVLQNEYGVNLRAIPGRNDVARLTPLLRNRANFAATGTSDVVYAQEGIFDFGAQGWGPQAFRMTLWNVADSCGYTLAAAGDAGIEEAADLRGKRVVYVQGSPSLNLATQALLSYANLTWDDVRQIDVGGYPAGIEAVVSGRADVFGTSCHSPVLLRVENAPRGVRLVQFPHDDQEAVDRMLSTLPWYRPHVTEKGPGIPEGRHHEGFTTAYPSLITTAEQDAGMVYAMTKVIIEHHDDYKDAAPAAEGWVLERQAIEDSVIPFHEGTIRYFREAGVWTEAAEARQQANLERQQVLQDAWARYTAQASTDQDTFRREWQSARAEALRDAGLDVYIESW